MRDLRVAYILWFFFGIAGGHRFYLGHLGMGILYFFTLGLFGIGWIIDAFRMPAMVDFANRELPPGGGPVLGVGPVVYGDYGDYGDYDDYDYYDDYGDYGDYGDY